ncbi:MAG TPA: DMP19 family protein [Chryseolinea sp.]|nr:DMP19 family protein [Chryseolinea sp.]
MDNQFSNEEAIVRSLEKGQKAIYVTWILEAEVNNGGFNQFYYNSSGQFADLSGEAFTTIGATKFAKLVNQANLVYDSIKDDLAKNDDGTIESFTKSYEGNPLNDLDTKFYELEKEEHLSELRIKYIRDNIKEFVNE